MQLHLVLVLALLSTVASKKKQTPRVNLSGRVFPIDICPALTQPSVPTSFDPALYTSGKTPYPIPAVQTISSDASQYKLLKVWLISRHGSRFPTEGNIYATLHLEQALQNVTNPQFDWIKSWKSPLDPKNSGQLHQVGKDDLLKLGQRALTHYGALFQSGTLDVRSTYVQRAQDSANAYLDAMFQPNDPRRPKVTFQAKKQDAEMRPWELCDKYRLAKDISGLKQFKETYQKPRMLAIAQRLTTLLGAQLKPSDVESIYAVCSTARSLCMQGGPFCALFTQQEMQQINYMKNMQYYYIHGTGNELNTFMSGPLLAAIGREMREAASNPTSGPRAYLRFNHAETVARLMNGLGLMQMPQENGQGFNQARDLPFTGNIYLELLQRGGTQLMRRSSKKHKKDHKKHAKDQQGQQVDGIFVRMRVNEQIRPIPGCNTDPCPLDKFLSITAPLASIQLSQVCALSPQDQQKLPTPTSKQTEPQEE